MKIIRWEGCYESSWKGLITDASFAHPAKFARGLIERIYDHCLAKGYLKRGDVVGDCFGGIGTGGITAAYRGLNWIGCELEPKFVKFANENFEKHRHPLRMLGFPMPRIIQGDSRKFDEHVAAVVSSPPYADSFRGQESGIDESKVKRPGGPAGNSTQTTGYGCTEGNIGTLSAGALDSVITSPPFAGTSGQGGGGINVNGYKPAPGRKWTGAESDPVGSRTYQGQGGDRTTGNIETLKEGTVQGVISSPPYSDIAAGAGGLNTKPAKKPGQQSGRKAESASQDTDQRYGTSTGQISQLKGGSADGVVSSPPWEDNCEGRVKASKFKSGHLPLQGKGHGCSHEARVRSALKSEEVEYGDSEGQIGKEAGETYWQAVDAVYRACFRAIRPGGIIVLVVKDYCAKGKRVRLCDDTMRLLQHIGFQPLERIHAMLVTETVEAGLWGDHRKKKQRKSFFRRIYEEKLPEGDDRRIDHEEVIICRRP